MRCLPTKFLTASASVDSNDSSSARSVILQTCTTLRLKWVQAWSQSLQNYDQSVHWLLVDSRPASKKLNCQQRSVWLSLSYSSATLKSSVIAAGNMFAIILTRHRPCHVHICMQVSHFWRFAVRSSFACACKTSADIEVERTFWYNHGTPCSLYFELQCQIDDPFGVQSSQHVKITHQDLWWEYLRPLNSLKPAIPMMPMACASSYWLLHGLLEYWYGIMRMHALWNAHHQAWHTDGA